jgi:hypothetical protein
MNMKRFSWAVALILGLANQAQAGWWVDHRANTLSNAKEGFYTYHTVRSAFTHETDGYAARINSLSSRVRAWVLAWATAKAKTDNASGPNLQRYEIEISELFQKQVRDLDKIYLDAMKLRMDLINAQNKLNSVARLGYEVDNYDSEYKQLLTSIDQLSAQIGQLKDTLTQLMDDLRSSSSSVYQALISRLRVVLFEKGEKELEKTVSRVRGILETDARLNALLNQAIQKKHDFDAAFLAMRYFATLRAGTDLVHTACPDLTQKMSSDPGSPVAKEAYLGELEKICSRTSKDLGFLQSKGAVDVTVSSIIQKRLPRGKARCLTNDPGPYQCGMLNWLGVLTETQIRRYDAKKLEALEKAWDMAEGIQQ